MRDFFRGWRRKAGCITLVMACVFMGGWIRSLRLQDQLIIGRPNSVHLLTSQNGTLAWSRSAPYFLTIPIHWKSTAFNKAMEGSWGDAEVHWSWQHSGFEFGAGTSTERSSIAGVFQRRSELWQVPYWAFTIPLTLLSAHLILWKPRNRQVTDA